MKATDFSEPSVYFFQAMLHYILEDRIYHNHCLEKLLTVEHQHIVTPNWVFPNFKYKNECDMNVIFFPPSVYLFIHNHHHLLDGDDDDDDDDDVNDDSDKNHHFHCHHILDLQQTSQQHISCGYRHILIEWHSKINKNATGITGRT
jgi:hypothetical protein